MPPPGNVTSQQQPLLPGEKYICEGHERGEGHPSPAPTNVFIRHKQNCERREPLPYPTFLLSTPPPPPHERVLYPTHTKLRETRGGKQGRGNPLPSPPLFASRSCRRADKKYNPTHAKKSNSITTPQNLVPKSYQCRCCRCYRSHMWVDVLNGSFVSSRPR